MKRVLFSLAIALATSLTAVSQPDPPDLELDYPQFLTENRLAETPFGLVAADEAEEFKSAVLTEVALRWPISTGITWLWNYALTGWHNILHCHWEVDGIMQTPRGPMQHYTRVCP